MEEQTQEENKNVKFSCPSCGVIEQDDVLFLCNTCDREDLIFQDGIYMCPSCLEEGDNFECTKCGSKKVQMERKQQD